MELTPAEQRVVRSVFNRMEKSNKTLLEACKEAQSFIFTVKGRKKSEFNIKNADYFHIQVILAEAIKQGEGH